jgi:integrase
VAKRPASKARGPVRDVRALEERRCMPRAMISVLTVHLRTIASAIPRDPTMLVETNIWLRLRDAYAFLSLLLTGLRRFEFCGVTCGDVDLALCRLWTIGKGKNRDFVPLSDQATGLLSAWLDCKSLRGESVDAEAPLFCATGVGGSGFLSFGALRLRWKRVLVEAGLPEHYGVHATRHAAGLLVYAQTSSIEKTARFLRHRSVSTTARHYLHIDADELRRELSVADLWGMP